MSINPESAQEATLVTPGEGPPASSEVDLLERMRRAHGDILREIRKEIVGQDRVVDQVLVSLFVGGHSIITGVPGLAVVAGPVEATALGNAIVQFIALGEIANVAEARNILASTVGSVTFEPDDDERWQGAFQRFCDLLDRQGSSSPA